MEIFAAGAQPVTGEDAGVGACGLSIKLDGQGVDGNGDVWVKEALHPKHACKQGSLGKILVLCQGQEGAVKVPVRNEDGYVLSRVRTKGQDASYGSLHSSKCAIMVGVEALLDACAVGEGEEGNDEVVRVWDWVDVDSVVTWGGLVRKINDCRRPSRCSREVEGGEYAGVGPGKACRDAEDWEGSGE